MIPGYAYRYSNCKINVIFLNTFLVHPVHPCNRESSPHPPSHVLYVYRDCNGFLGKDDDDDDDYNVPQTDPDTSESGVRPSRTDDDGSIIIIHLIRVSLFYTQYIYIYTYVCMGLRSIHYHICNESVSFSVIFSLPSHSPTQVDSPADVLRNISYAMTVCVRYVRLRKSSGTVFHTLYTQRLIVTIYIYIII